jgi:LysM repeat protein
MSPFIYRLAVLVALPLGLSAEQVNIYGQTRVAEPSAPIASPAVPSQKITAPDPGPALEPATTPFLRHTVTKGDSLWKISKQYKIPIKTIKETNSLKTDNIQLGQVLLLPTDTPPQLEQGQEIRRAIPVDPTTVPPPAPAPVATPPPSEKPTTESSPPLRDRFLTEVKRLAEKRIGYNEKWHPPGEPARWVMDCSNTTRWLYRRVAAIELARTASSQYYELQQQNRAWLAPRNNGQTLSAAALARYLRVGDLLFWEHTYKPQRTPPITHVMIYLGRDPKGRLLMAGSQTSSGLYNPEGSGPDVYYFDPQGPRGGYRTGLFGMSHVEGRFVAYGRPLALNPLS